MWTWRIISITKNPSGLDCSLVYSVTDGTNTDTITEGHVSFSPPDDIKSACVRICTNACDYRNRVDSQKTSLGTADLSVLVGSQDTVVAAIELQKPRLPGPTQQQLDQQIFFQWLTDYRAALAGESLGLSIAPDSATCLAEIRSRFLPEYKSLLIGR